MPRSAPSPTSTEPTTPLEDLLPGLLDELGLGRATPADLLARHPEHAQALASLLDLAVRFWNAPRTPPRPTLRQRLERAALERRDRAIGRARERIDGSYRRLRKEVATRWQPVQEALDRFIAGEYSLKEMLLVVGAHTWLLVTHLAQAGLRSLRQIATATARRDWWRPGFRLPSAPSRPSLPPRPASAGARSSPPSGDALGHGALAESPVRPAEPAARRPTAVERPAASAQPPRAWRQPVRGLGWVGALLLLVALFPSLTARLSTTVPAVGAAAEEQLPKVRTEGEVLPSWTETAAGAQETASALVTRLAGSRDGREELQERALRNARWALLDLRLALARERASLPGRWQALRGRVDELAQGLLATFDEG